MADESSDESLFQIDVRDVLQRQRDKGYSTLGEAFEDCFADWWSVNEQGVVVWDWLGFSPKVN